MSRSRRRTWTLVAGRLGGELPASKPSSAECASVPAQSPLVCGLSNHANIAGLTSSTMVMTSAGMLARAAAFLIASALGAS